VAISCRYCIAFEVMLLFLVVITLLRYSNIWAWYILLICIVPLGTMLVVSSFHLIFPVHEQKLDLQCACRRKQRSCTTYSWMNDVAYCITTDVVVLCIMPTIFANVFA